MPSSLSIGITGGIYGATLGRAANWEDFDEGSATLSCGENQHDIPEKIVNKVV